MKLSIFHIYVTKLNKSLAFRLLFLLFAIPNNSSTSVRTIVIPPFCRLFSICFHTFVTYLHLISRWSMDSIPPWQNVHLLLFDIPHLNNVSFVIKVWCKMSRSLVEAVLDKIWRKILRKCSLKTAQYLVQIYVSDKLRESELWGPGVRCEFKIWVILYLHRCGAVCNIVLQRVVL